MPQSNSWEAKFRALTRFKARNGHCFVPPRHREGGIKLGRWVIDQRRAFATGKLPNERMLCLQRIGLPLNPREAGWHTGIAALSRFKKREGHCNVAKAYHEGGLRLGEWVANLRKRWLSLPTQRRRQLERLGFTLSAREASWKRHFEALLRFKSREGHCLVPRAHVARGIKLGVWVNNQRSLAAQMPSERKLQLDATGFLWKTGRMSGSMPGYAKKKYRTRYQPNAPSSAI